MPMRQDHANERQLHAEFRVHQHGASKAPTPAEGNVDRIVTGVN